MPPRRKQTAGFNQELRDILHGPGIRGMAGIRDGADVVVAIVGRPDGDAPVEVDSERREIKVHTEDAATDVDGDGTPRESLLYAPCNALWRKPPAGDKVTVLQPQDVGEPLALHGDGGATSTTPSRLTDTNTVLSPPTGALLCESRDGNAQVDAPGSGKKVILGGDSASDAVLKGTTYRNAEVTLHSALSTFLTADATAWTAMATLLGALGTAMTNLGQAAAATACSTAATAATAKATAATAMGNAVSTFENGSANYLSQKTVTE